MITNSSTAPVKCSHCTLFSETNTVRVAKKPGHPASPQTPWNSMTELSGSIADIFLLTYSLWSPYGIGQIIIFSSCRLFFFFLLSFFLA